jgi:hypothetical protein
MGGEFREIVLYHNKISFTANIRSTLSFLAEPNRLIENLPEKRRELLQLYIMGGEFREIVLYHNKFSFTANIRSILSFSAEPNKLLENLAEKRQDLLCVYMRFKRFEMERHCMEYQI